MKSFIIGTLYGARSESEELKKVLNKLDFAKIEHNFKDSKDAKGGQDVENLPELGIDWGF